MERVHKPDSRPWILAGSVIINEFIEFWANHQIDKELNINKSNVWDFVKNELEIDEQVIKLLEKDINPSNLNCCGEEEELYVAYEKSFDIPNNVNLETLRLQKEHVEKYAIDRCYRTASLQSLRYRNRLIKVEKQQTINGQIITRPEVILTVQFYRPIRQSTHFGNTHRYSFICDQELAVLSSQSLTQLRDAFTCVSDISTPGDCSDNPRTAHSITAADVYKSGFFFINNTFYNDMRHPFNRDYSKTIIDWSSDSDRGIGPFKTAKMEETNFADLEIQLGYPYLYLHQGDCEHIMVFSDIRLLLPFGDSMEASDYPKIVSTNRRTQIRCGLCNLNTAKWITYGNKRLPEDPFFFCESCFYTFNYDKNEEKIGSFKAYPYLDKSALL